MMNKKILVVDDSAVNRFVIESMLTDFDLIEAENGDEMYNALKNNSVNLILLDIMMPGKSGLELAEELREDYRYENIPIIFVSAKSSGDDIEVGLDIGVDDYIVKPVDENILRARISSVMRRARKTDMLNALATTDPLTGLYNRRFFFKRAEEEWNLAVRKNKKLAIAMIDIDHFKRVNDTFGHDNGDIVLKEMAKIISDGLRSCDVVARYGGEEFVLFLSDCTKEEALIKISEIRDVILTISRKNSPSSKPSLLTL